MTSRFFLASLLLPLAIGCKTRGEVSTVAADQVWPELDDGVPLVNIGNAVFELGFEKGQTVVPNGTNHIVFTVKGAASQLRCEMSQLQTVHDLSELDWFRAKGRPIESPGPSIKMDLVSAFNKASAPAGKLSCQLTGENVPKQILVGHLRCLFPSILEGHLSRNSRDVLKTCLLGQNITTYMKFYLDVEENNEPPRGQGRRWDEPAREQESRSDEAEDEAEDQAADERARRSQERFYCFERCTAERRFCSPDFARCDREEEACVEECRRL